MDSVRLAKKELNGLFGMMSAAKFLLLFFSLYSSSLLYWILSAVYGDQAPSAFEQFVNMDTVSGLLFEAIIFLIAVGLPICGYFFLSGKKYSKIVPMKRPKPLQICYGVGSCVLLGQLSAALGNSFLMRLFYLFGLEDVYEAMLQSDVAYPTKLGLIPLLALVIAVFPAFMEETMFRGAGLHATKKYGTAFSILFSGCFFALMHSSWVQIPFAFVLGCLLAYFTIRFQTIWIAVITHFVFNFNSVVLCLIQENLGEFSDGVSGIWAFLFFTLMIGFAVAGAIVYRFRMEPKAKSEYRFKDGISAMLRCPFFYVFLVLEALQLLFLIVIYSSIV